MQMQTPGFESRGGTCVVFAFAAGSIDFYCTPVNVYKPRKVAAFGQFWQASRKLAGRWAKKWGAVMWAQ